MQSACTHWRPGQGDGKGSRKVPTSSTRSEAANRSSRMSMPRNTTRMPAARSDRA
ncbi:hypothetical protein AZA_86064 [Nitrospirillum viridazoti Y2]|nr:hypothetical protein AZA_86064 [Nitrospirillum amazonense Y2]